MAGALSVATLSAAKDENGTGFREAAAAAGYPSSSIQVGLEMLIHLVHPSCSGLLSCHPHRPVHASSVKLTSM